MKLHGNARTCPKSRRLLVERIVEEGWSLTEAAEAAGVSERTARKWVARFRAEGEAGLRDRSSAPKRIPHRTPAERVEAIEALRRLRMTAAEIAEALGDGALDGLAVAEADRARQALAARAAGAAEPLRAPPPGRARPRRHQEARPDLGAAGKRVGRPSRHAQAAGYGWEFVPRDDRRPQPARLRRGPPRRARRRPRSASCGAPSRGSRGSASGSSGS